MGLAPSRRGTRTMQKQNVEVFCMRRLVPLENHYTINSGNVKICTCNQNIPAKPQCVTVILNYS